MIDNLTDEYFWDDYWKNQKIPTTVDLNFSFERCLAHKLKSQILQDFKGKTILEIGCAPGKWLTFFAREFGMIPFGIDYSEKGIDATKRNFDSLGLNTNGLKTADFLAIEPDNLHDVVISLGFIEHFEDPDTIVEKHLGWLRPGGTLILGVPNFRGIYKPIQKILSNEILEKHNLEVMSLDYFYNLSKKFDIKLMNVSYLGSFEPCLFIDKNTNPDVLQRTINIFLRLLKKIRCVEFFDNLNHKWISSYILAIYEKPDPNA